MKRFFVKWLIGVVPVLHSPACYFTYTAVVFPI